MENIETLVFAVVIGVLVLMALVILGSLVFSYLWGSECPKCHKYLALKIIARTKLEPGLYKYEYRCKYCNFERERIEDTLPYLGPPSGF